MLRTSALSMFALGLVVAAGTLEHPAQLQSAPVLATATLTHLAIATPNVDTTARRRIFESSWTSRRPGRDRSTSTCRSTA